MDYFGIWATYHATCLKKIREHRVGFAFAFCCCCTKHCVVDMLCSENALRETRLRLVLAFSIFFGFLWSNKHCCRFDGVLFLNDLNLENVHFPVCVLVFVCIWVLSLLR